jgi:CHAT domain-containing protein
MKKITVFSFIFLTVFISESFLIQAQTLKDLNDSTSFYMNHNDLTSAKNLAGKALILSEKKFGKQDTNYAMQLLQLGEIYFKMENMDSALICFNESLKIFKSNFHTDNLLIASTLKDIGEAYYALNRFQEAEKYYLEDLSILISLHKGDNVHKANILGELGYVYYELGKNDKVEKYTKESIEMYKRLEGNNNIQIAHYKDILGMAYENQARFEEAGIIYKEILEIYRKEFKGDDIHIAQSLNGLGVLSNEQGKYLVALEYYYESINMFKRLIKGEDSEIANCLDNIGAVYHNLGQFDKAESYYLESYEMYKRVYKADNDDIAVVLTNLGVLYDNLGRYSEAESYKIGALNMLKRIYNGDHHRLIVAYNNLFQLYLEMGRYEEAEKTTMEALNMAKRMYKTDHPQIAFSLNQLANLYYYTGNYSKSESILKETLEMRRRIYKIDHPELIRSINNMASNYKILKKHEQAELLYKEGLDMAKRLYKNDHVQTAYILNMLGLLYSDMKRYNEAENLLNESIEMRKRLFKNGHLDLAKSLIGFSYLYQKHGKNNESEPPMLEALIMLKDQFENNISFASEKEKEQYWNTIKQYIEDFNTFVYKRYKESPEILKTAYNNQLFTKGLLLNSNEKLTNSIMKSNNKELIGKFEEFRQEHKKIAKYYNLTSVELREKGINFDSVLNDANKREKELNSLSQIYQNEYSIKKISYINIQIALKQNEAAIEIVRFRISEDLKFTGKVMYAALILKNPIKDSSKKTKIENKEIDFVVLENGNELESQYIQDYKDNIENNEIDETSYNIFWADISKKLKGIKKVYVAPDGIYNLINLNTLYNPKTKKYLIDEIDLTMLTSTRDLLKIRNNAESVSINNKNAEFFGNPAFEIDSSKAKLISENQNSKAPKVALAEVLKLENNDLTRDLFNPLPNSKYEILEIQNLFNKYSPETKVNVYLEDQASEDAIKSLKNPRLLHIATHGMFLKDYDTLKEKKGQQYNPLLSSMLFLSGSKSSFFGIGTRNTGKEDGILSAYEVMNLNLDNTELVILSACETGLGEVHNGEGVYGLQRAFIQAGAKSIIMSMWKVSDKATTELMLEFYKQWLSGKSKSDAFKSAQIKVRNKYKYPSYWGAFVMVGE